MAYVAHPAVPDVLRLVADPLRWELLAHLGLSDRRVAELVALSGKAQNLVSYHLKELRDGGLVSSRRSSADGRDTYYRLEAAWCGTLLGAASAALHPGLAVVPAPPSVPRRKRRVLFLCTGNSARSQMAEALLEHHSGGTVEARSAGSHPKDLHPLAVRVMAERGIDIAGRPTKHLDRFARSRFDRVVTLCDRVREVCPEFPGPAPTAHWSMADPSAAGDGTDVVFAAFDAAADELDGRVALLLSQLAQEDPARAR